MFNKKNILIVSDLILNVIPCIKKNNLFIYFFRLCWVFAAAQTFSQVVASKGYSLVAVHGLLIAVASLVVEHRL